MKKDIFKTLAAAGLITMMGSFAAFADTAITQVTFTYTIDGESSITKGYNDPEVEISGDMGYDVSDFSLTSSSTDSISGKSALSYTLTLAADSGYYFPSANSISVSGNGITEITSKKVSSSDNGSMTIKFKAYPYYQLSAPSFTTAFDKVCGSSSTDDKDNRGTSVTINKNGASKVEYIISYVDQNGEEKTKSGTSSSTSISVGSYNKRYTGSSSDKQSAYILGIAMRATGLSSSSNPYVAPSEWVYIDGGETSIDTEEYYTEYSTWDDFTSKKTTSNSSSSSTGTATTSTTGWQGSGDSWYYYSNGTKLTGWVQDGGKWYYCNPSNGGLMTSGWIQDSTGAYFLLNKSHDGTFGCLMSGWVQDGGYWYYLNPEHDGTFGRMMTGWVTVNGYRYYLKPNSGGPMGSMVTGAYVIDGTTYNFNSNGTLAQ